MGMMGMFHVIAGLAGSGSAADESDGVSDLRSGAGVRLGLALATC